MPQAKRSTKGSRKFARKNLVFSKTLAALPATRSPGLPMNTVMCQERMMPLSSRACQSGSQARVVELGIDVGDHEIHLAHAALGPHPLELGERALGRLWQHRQADEPFGRRLA